MSHTGNLTGLIIILEEQYDTWNEFDCILLSQYTHIITCNQHKCYSYLAFFVLNLWNVSTCWVHFVQFISVFSVTFLSSAVTGGWLVATWRTMLQPVPYADRKTEIRKKSLYFHFQHIFICFGIQVFLGNKQNCPQVILQRMMRWQTPPINLCSHHLLTLCLFFCLLLHQRLLGIASLVSLQVS